MAASKLVKMCISMFRSAVICINIFSFSVQLHAAEIKVKMSGKRFVFDDSILKMHPNSALAKMFLGDALPKKDSRGYFIIDGDPECFKHILSYWKYRDADIARGNIDLDLLTKQAEYFGADDFCCFIDGFRKSLGSTRLPKACPTFYTIKAYDERDANLQINNLQKDWEILSIETTPLTDKAVWMVLKMLYK